MLFALLEHDIDLNIQKRVVIPSFGCKRVFEDGPLLSMKSDAGFWRCVSGVGCGLRAEQQNKDGCEDVPHGDDFLNGSA